MVFGIGGSALEMGIEGVAIVEIGFGVLGFLRAEVSERGILVGLGPFGHTREEREGRWTKLIDVRQTKEHNLFFR